MNNKFKGGNHIDRILIELEGKLPAKYLEEWGFEALKNFSVSGKRQVQTVAGNWPYDRRRSRDPFQWSVSELRDWAEGKIFPGGRIKDSVAWDAIRVRWKLPSNWNRHLIKAYILEGKFPEYTFSGLLKEDFIRESSSITALTYNELMGIVCDEVTYSGNKDDVITQLHKNYGLHGANSINRAVEHYLNGNYQMSMESDQILAILKERVELFKKNGKNVTDQSLANNLTSLYNVLRRVAKMDYPDFAECWKVLLKYINDNYEVAFNPLRMRRGWNILALTPAAIGALDGILYLVEATRDPRTRFIASQAVNLDYALKNFNNPKEIENFRSFYSVE